MYLYIRIETSNIFKLEKCKIFLSEGERGWRGGACVLRRRAMPRRASHLAHTNKNGKKNSFL